MTDEETNFEEELVWPDEEESKRAMVDRVLGPRETDILVEKMSPDAAIIKMKEVIGQDAVSLSEMANKARAEGNEQRAGVCEAKIKELNEMAEQIMALKGQRAVEYVRTRALAMSLLLESDQRRGADQEFILQEQKKIEDVLTAADVIDALTPTTRILGQEPKQKGV